MVHEPFKTMMERAHVLSLLRTKHALPEDFTSSHPHPAKIILALTHPDPGSRPSATQLLDSPDLPGKMEVEAVYMREALTTIANPQSESFARLVTAL
jgi:predicted outer membrane protein